MEKKTRVTEIEHKATDTDKKVHAPSFSDEVTDSIKPSSKKLTALIIGSIIAIMAIIFIVLSGSSSTKDLTGSQKISELNDSWAFSFTAPEQFEKSTIESDIENESLNQFVYYAYLDEDTNNYDASIVVIAESFEGITELLGIEKNELKEYYSDFYLNQSRGEQTLKGILDIKLNLDNVEIINKVGSSSFDDTKIFSSDFTAENDGGDVDVSGEYIFYINDSNDIAYNLIISGNSIIEDNPGVIKEIIDSFTFE